MKKRYIGYYRVSRDSQEYGISSQKDIVRRFVESQNGILEMEFCEVESGKLTADGRPQLAAALDYCRRNKSVTCVISKLDRLARNAEFLLRLQNSGVDFVCCDCPNADRFTVGILAMVAQRERELISERTKLGLAVAAKTKKLGTPNPKKAVAAMVAANKIAKSEFVNKVLPLIREIQSAGVQTLQGIADCLNRRGISTRTGKQWYPTTVRNTINGGGL